MTIHDCFLPCAIVSIECIPLLFPFESKSRYPWIFSLPFDFDLSFSWQQNLSWSVVILDVGFIILALLRKKKKPLPFKKKLSYQLPYSFPNKKKRHKTSIVKSSHRMCSSSLLCSRSKLTCVEFSSFPSISIICFRDNLNYSTYSRSFFPRRLFYDNSLYGLLR